MDLLIIISVLWIGSEIILSRLRRADVYQDAYDKSSLKIIWITIFLVIPVGIILKNTDFRIITTPSLLYIYLCEVFICAGLIIRWIAILRLKSAFTVDVSVSENQKIITTGIYKYIRHPAYTGALLSFLGLGMIFNNIITLVVIFIPILSVFIYRIKIEEKLLMQVFDKKYTDYMAHTWRLVPKIF